MSRNATKEKDEGNNKKERLYPVPDRAMLW
jgi:hypothetical protein